MKKRIRAVLIVIGMGILLFVQALSYVQQNETELSDTTENGALIGGAVTDDSEISHMIMTYQTMSDSRLDDLEQVLEAVNSISRAEIGVEIELRLVDASESAEEYPLWITQGKQMDLMLLNYQDITSYVEHGMLQSLDTLLGSYGSGINEISEKWMNLYSGSTIQNQIYGVAVPSEGKGNCGGIWIPKRYLDEIDFDYDENHIYTYEELDALFAKLKANHKTAYPFGQIPTRYNFSTGTFMVDTELNALGSSILTGTLDANTEAPQIVNYFESEEYYIWLTYMRRWYQKGYVYPDAAFTTLTNEALLKAGIVMSIPHSGAPFLFLEDKIEEPIICLRTTRITYGKSSSTGVFWTIPKTAKDPEAAMKFLNLMYTNEKINNLFAWGIEGKDYVKQSDGSVTYVEGENADTIGYYNPLGLYGDKRQTYAWKSVEKKEKILEFSKQAVEVGQEYYEFSFDAAPVGTQINQVQKVLDRYLDPLETGSVNLKQVYPEFVQELHVAGIDIIMEEKQRQLDEWLETQENERKVKEK